MHEAALARAALPAPTEVLGMALQDYSIGHEVYLQREAPEIQSLTPKDQSPEAREALVTAVLICCQSWEDNRGMARDWLLGLKLAIWRRRLRRMVKRQGSKFWQEQLERFQAYREAGSLEFPLSEIIRSRSGPEPRPPGSPFLLRLHQFLVLKLGLSQAAAWDYPLGLAKMEWASYWEEEGGLQIYNWQDAAHDDYVAKCEAEDAAAAATPESPAAPAPQGGVKAELAHLLQVMDGSGAATQLDCTATDGCKATLPTNPSKGGALA
jgi:hypothetical protein